MYFLDSRLLKMTSEIYVVKYIYNERFLTETTIPDLGSKTRNFLSLQVVANKLPSRFRDML